VFPILRKSLFLVTVLSFYSIAHGQRLKGFYQGYNEWGIVAGVSNYYGDLSHNYNLKQTQPSAGITYKYNRNGYFSYRFGLSYLKVGGTDEGHKVYDQRNLSFQTPIIELGGNIEFNFKRFGTSGNDAKGTVYVFTGLNAFYFNPTRLEDKEIKLRRLRTEGTKTYSTIQPAIPLGIGYKRMFRQRRHKGAWIIGVEANWRKTFTDKLDDVDDTYMDYKDQVNSFGQGNADYGHPETLKGIDPFPAGTMRGDTHLKDWYYFIGLSLSYRFTPFICTRFN
jgi:hypothetical protein